ncbi:MAG: ABC transporter transmembrane domain-containing protein, partial [Candidatus Hodarchaeales archaeon]
ITALSFRKIARSTVAEQRKSVAAVNTSFQESIAGVNVSKSFAKEKKTFEDFREVNDDNYRKGMRRAFVFVSIFPIIDLIATLGIAAILFYGGNLATISVHPLSSTLFLSCHPIKYFLQSISRRISRLGTHSRSYGRRTSSPRKKGCD